MQRVRTAPDKKIHKSPNEKIQSYTHFTITIRHGDDPIKVNFGGFVSLSTIDWRGRSVCTMFLRGCPLRCSYCQNEAIQQGEDLREIDEITDMIQTSSPFISGVVFSGGEPTLQKEALIELAAFAQKKGLAVGIQTNGFYPGTIETLIDKKLVDRVALDYKTRWEAFPGTWDGYCATENENYERNVRRSIAICKRAVDAKILTEFEVVLTVFYENGKYIREISDRNPDVPLVLQQGEHKIALGQAATPGMTNGEYISIKRNLQEHYTPMTFAEIKKIADELKRTVRIRTREIGEISYYKWSNVL